MGEKLMRVVLDTNCIISVLLFSNKPLAWLRYSWQSGQITPLVSKETVNELLRVLTYPKFKLTTQEQELLLADFLPYVEIIQIETVPDDLPRIRDKHDQMFLVLAVVSDAKVLVTGDKDILEIQTTFHNPPIMTLAEFNTYLTSHI
jgi:putative PIN family toxin of toxin-antitoxin system